MKSPRVFRAKCLCIVAMALTTLAFASTILGCTSHVVYVAPSKLTEMHLMLNASNAADARRPAHLLAYWVRGQFPDRAGILTDGELPEPYVRDNERSFRPAPYHLGYAAERLIRQHYSAKHSRGRMIEQGTLQEIAQEAGADIDRIADIDKNRRTDIADVPRRLIFEIVPPGQTYRAAAINRLDWYLHVLGGALRKGAPFKRGTDYAGEVGVRFAEESAPWKLAWATVTPGVVQYRWQTLRVEKQTEDAYREAYVTNHWRDVTNEEIARFGRALHEVVERLAQIREELGPTRAAETMPVLPGKTMADYLRSVSLWSAKNDDVARLLPVAREPKLPDRRFLGDTAGSGAGSSPKMHPGATTPDGLVVPPHPSAPEPYAYTTRGRPGSMPYGYFLGYAAHRVIAYHYEVLRRGRGGAVFKNHFSVATIVKEAKGEPTWLSWEYADLRPDITHLRDKEKEQFVYEIKPQGPVHLEKGKEKLAQYIGTMNVGMAGKPKVFVPGPDYQGELWIRFKDGKELWRITWQTTAPGLVQYKWDEPHTHTDEDDIKAREQAWARAVAEGRWRDISAADLEQHAEDLFLAIEEMVQRRELLGQFRDSLTLPIQAVGVAAETALAANLYRLLDSVRTVVPVVRQPIEAAKPIPPINARSLGSDAKPGLANAPGKTNSRPQHTSPN